MKISFCMPVFNKEIYLADAIESVLRQTHKDIELIIADDCSTDGTPDVAQWYAQRHRNIMYVRNNKNIGVASCRNKLWNLATGKILCIQDADDLSLPERARIMNDYFKTHPETDIVYGTCLLTDVFNRKLGERQAQDFAIHRLKGENYISHPTVAYRKNISIRYRDGLRYIDDWYFYMDCIKFGYKMEGIIQPLSIYRVTHDGLTLNNGFMTPKKRKERVNLLKEFADMEEDLTEKLTTIPTQKKRIKQIVKLIDKKSTVLDVGCNGGHLMTLLKKKGCNVHGVERSGYLVNICRKKNLAVIKGDFLKTKIPKIFDYIVFGDILEHHQPKVVEKILEHAYYGLNKGGQIVITVPYKHGMYSTKTVKEHVHDYELSDFQKMFPSHKIKERYVTYEDIAVPIWLLITITK